MSDDWKKVLEPFGQLFWDLTQAIRGRIDAMTDVERAQLRDAVKKPTNTNVWYASADVAPIVEQQLHEHDFAKKHGVKA